jgi:hypothetical protein
MLVDNLGQAVRKQLVDGLLADMLQDGDQCDQVFSGGNYHIPFHKLLHSVENYHGAIFSPKMLGFFTKISTIKVWKFQITTIGQN